MTQKIKFHDLTFNSCMKAFMISEPKIFMHNQLQVLFAWKFLITMLLVNWLVDHYSVIVLLGLVSWRSVDLPVWAISSTQEVFFKKVKEYFISSWRLCEYTRSLDKWVILMMMMIIANHRSRLYISIYAFVFKCEKI